jgi:transposase InsO family protein
VLAVAPSTLAEWNGEFDREMNPVQRPDGRGTASKITAETVRQVVAAARTWLASGKPMRLDRFTEHLSTEHGIHLSRTKVTEILVANDLHQVQIRNRRPRFYQSLRQAIPNGLVGVDGSAFSVWVDGTAHRFNVELCVDIPSFHHSAFCVSDTESSEEVLQVLEERRVKWGVPLGLLADHDSANLSAQTRSYLQQHGIELVPIGPGNPKGNGTLEGAFSQLKRTIGKIAVDTLSPRELAQSVLEAMVGLYVRMRNRLPVGRSGTSTPEAQMNEPISAAQREAAKARYRQHRERKRNRPDPSWERKRERLEWIIRYHHLEVDEPSRQRGEKSIVHYELEAITEIQRQKDTERYQEYCRQRYEYHRMLEREREVREEQTQRLTVETAVEQLCAAVSSPLKPLRDLAMKQGRRMLHSLKAHYRYLGVLRKKIAEALGAVPELTVAQRTEILVVVEETLA